MNTNPPTYQTYPVSLSLYTYFGGLVGCVVVGWLEGSWGGGWGVHGVGGWRVHGVGWCVVVWVVVGCMVGWWMESSWMGEYMHPPHPGLLGMMGRWVWAGGHGCDGWVGITGGWAWGCVGSGGGVV